MMLMMIIIIIIIIIIILILVLVCRDVRYVANVVDRYVLVL